MTIYADTTFIVSVYVTDRNSLEARQRFSESPRGWFTQLHRVEWAHAIAQQSFHRAMTPSEASQIYNHLEMDQSAGLWVDVRLPEMVFELGADLARRHGPRLGIRTLDSLHVASALLLKADRFWTFDDRQAKLAKAEGLKAT